MSFSLLWMNGNCGCCVHVLTLFFWVAFFGLWFGDLAVKFKGNIGRFNNFNKYLLVAVVLNEEWLPTPGVEANSRHDEHAGAYLEEWLRDSHINGSTKVQAVVLVFVTLVFAFAFFDVNCKLIGSFHCPFVLLEANEAHAQIYARFWLKGLLNVLVGADNEGLHRVLFASLFGLSLYPYRILWSVFQIYLVVFLTLCEDNLVELLIGTDMQKGLIAVESDSVRWFYFPETHKAGNVLLDLQ